MLNRNFLSFVQYFCQFSRIYITSCNIDEMYMIIQAKIILYVLSQRHLLPKPDLCVFTRNGTFFVVVVASIAKFSISNFRMQNRKALTCAKWQCFQSRSFHRRSTKFCVCQCARNVYIMTSFPDQRPRWISPFLFWRP